MRPTTTLAARGALPSIIALAALGTLAPGCVNDPVYLPGPAALEASGGVDADGNPIAATAQHVLPIRLETGEEARDRAMLAAELGVEVPYVKVGDLEVSVEWTITNVDTMPGTALVQLNGANEAFAYDPTLIVIGDPDEDPPAPGLEGDVPLHVEPGATIRGVFREDQLREASIDLDQITRANLHPFAATLQVHKNAAFFQPMSPIAPDMEQEPMGAPIPREAFRQMIRVDLVFKPDRAMVMEYTIRVRDVRGIMHELLDAAVTEAPGELTAFAPADFTATFP